MKETGNILADIATITGGDAILTDQAAAPYYTDWRGRYSARALAVVFPADTQQVSAVVKLCVARQIAIVPQGGNTSLCGGSIPRAADPQQIVLNLSRMDRVIAVDPINYTITVQAGCTLASVREAAEKNDRLFPLGLTAIAPHCQIGGNLATNAGGINVMRYGNMRDLTLGLEVVLPDGRIWNGLRSLRKDNTGYDLKQLFIGAEGTLGIITSAVLKLFPLPQSTALGCIAITSPEAAVRLLAHLRKTCGQSLSGFEIISRSCLDLVFKHIEDTHEPFLQRYDWYVLAQLADGLQVSLDGALRSGLQQFGQEVLEFAITSDTVIAENWWKLRKNISEAQKREGLSIKHDIAVPVSRVADFIAQASAALHQSYSGLRIVAFGHMGDGNIHYNISLLDADKNPDFIAQHEEAVNHLVYGIVHQLNGSISAEHGLGQLKRDEITHYKSALELELMRSIKQTLDPHGLMNPGKVV
jgi:FAD/FMN-containing dehydrogenase